MLLKTLPPFEEYKCYLVYHRKEKRRFVVLYKTDTKRTTISLAKYLMSLKLKRRLKHNEIIHHINGNSLDDRVTNYKLVNTEEHGKLHSTGWLFVELICPICKNVFSKQKNKTHFIVKSKIVTACGYECGYELLKKSREEKLLMRKEQQIIREFRTLNLGWSKVVTS